MGRLVRPPHWGLWNLVFHVKGEEQIEGVWEQGAEETHAPTRNEVTGGTVKKSN
jgi:hypothetical protein